MRLVLLARAKHDLDEIGAYIERQSNSRAAAVAFTDKIIARCEKLAASPIIMGRPRPELQPGLRSVPFGRYIIFLRYSGEPHDTLEIVNILHGSRDIEALFSEDDENT